MNYLRVENLVQTTFRFLGIRYCALRLQQITTQQLESAISNKREPKSFLGQVFNSKLGCIDRKHCKYKEYTQSILELKTPPQIFPSQLKFVHARTAEKMTVDEMSVDKMASCHIYIVAVFSIGRGKNESVSSQILTK
jgi:hypothetical protein